MSPTPLIELQRRLAEAGRIRMGEKTDQGAPKRLTTWRITSPTKELIEQAAGLYGGKPREWDSPTGKQWEVVTTSSELPVLVMPGYSLRQSYEYRTSPTKVERRCDGQEMDDGSPCACNAEGFSGEECSLITRLTVALPELTTMLGWRLESKGDNAARELLASMDLVQGVAGGRPFVPARLRIVERRGAVDGQAVRYVVPVIDVSMRYSELGMGEKPQELPNGYVPLQALPSGVPLAEGLAAADRQRATRTARSAAPIPESDDHEFGAAVPVDEGGEYDKEADDARALNALVGSMRSAGEITTRNLYTAVAQMRGLKPNEETNTSATDLLIARLEGEDEAGELHWSPLRDSLTPEETAALRQRLGRKWAAAQAGAAA